MKKLILIILSSILLTGCKIYFVFVTPEQKKPQEQVQRDIISSPGIWLRHQIFSIPIYGCQSNDFKIDTTKNNLHFY
jgi:hypothetical protein